MECDFWVEADMDMELFLVVEENALIIVIGYMMNKALNRKMIRICIGYGWRNGVLVFDLVCGLFVLI